MLLSRKWLQEFVDTADIPDRDFGEVMTLSGSKTETVTALDRSLKNVAAGQIVSMERHPDSDHMWVCQVDVGEAGPIQIVTGAWNVHAGDLVPVARDGALLPGEKKIVRSKLRGVLSDGMLCGLRELGLSDVHDFPECAVIPAALLNDYKPLDPEQPSVPADIRPGDKVFGPVICAAVESVAPAGAGWACRLSWGEGGSAAVTTPCCNLHAGDLAAYDTKAGLICTLPDLRARQEEFPHCIPDGVWVLPKDSGLRPGDDIAPFLGADDHIADFEITPNRPDCLSVIGLAREASAAFGRPLKLHTPRVKGSGGNIADLADVEIEDAALCPRYTARVLKNVKIRPSPLWMRQRLRNSGIRPINNIVDITNYVMLEYGQPMHAFDFSCVEGGRIVVRTARAGETIETLDGTIRTLTPSMLCICDEKKPVCVAGVMGGANSEIVGDTATVLLESANFSGPSVRRTAAELNMRTDASARYEKGLDPMNTLTAVERACELVELLEAGEVVDGILDVIAADSAPVTVDLRPEKINALLGTQIPSGEMVRILESLSFKVEGERVSVPSWRSDVAHWSDLAEEVARFHGYDAIPQTLSGGLSQRRGLTPRQKTERLLGAVCRHAGYHEIITYSFVSPACFDAIRLPQTSPLRDALKILNPLGEDTSVMRTTTLPSMLETMQRNESVQNTPLRLYELGRIYLKDGESIREPLVLTLGAYGGEMDLFALKGAVEAIAAALHIPALRFQPEGDDPAYHPGRCANVYSGGTHLGILGQIHPLTAQNYGAGADYFAAQLWVDALCRCQGPQPVYQPLPRFPAVVRDIAVVCGASVTADRLEEAIRAGAGGLVQTVKLFDIYEGPGMETGKKSVAFRLTLRSDTRSLTSQEAEEEIRAILSSLARRCGAVLR